MKISDNVINEETNNYDGIGVVRDDNESCKASYAAHKALFLLQP